MIFDTPPSGRKARQFTLAPAFTAEYEGRQPEWGPVGYFTYKRCVDVSTPVLCDDLQWRPAGDLKVGQGIVGFDANVEGRGRFRHLRHGVILHNKVERAHTLGVELEDGTVIYATPDHGWLVKLSETDHRLYWKETKDLAETHKGGAVHLLRPFGPVWKPDSSYEGGYLSAAYDGEGCLDRHNGIQFIQVQNEMLDRVREFLTQKGVPFTQSKRKKVEGRKQVFVLRTSGRQSFYRVLGRFLPQRLVAKFTERLKAKGGGALRTSPEDYVRVVRVFDAGERNIAVISTSTETHFTGGFASHNTYARPTCDCNDPHTCGHSTEEFWQSCKRVVEGVYNVQKMHCRRLQLPWNEPKAQQSAQSMFRRMWEFKFTPPGRGLAQMGADFMFEKGGACLNNCFSSATKAWVQQSGFDGPRLAPLGELAEFSQGERAITILAGDGKMRRAVARSFGTQKLMKVSFAPRGLRSNYRLEYDVTPNHRWLLADGSETTALKVGDRVKVDPARYFESNDSTEIEGFTHGLIFGDGARHTYYANRHQIRLCGEKEQIHLARLEQSEFHFNTTHPKSYNGDAMVWFKLNDGMNWKALPSENSGVAYQRAFLQGWMAADDTGKPAGTRCLHTQNPEAAQWLVERAPLLGFCVTGFNYDSVMETNYGPRSAPMARITLTTETTEYTVKSITDEGREEEVYCITEPETGTFTLDGGLVTGNCAFVSSEHIDQDFAGPFTFLMDMSMLGVGVGGDTRGAGKVKLQMPKMSDEAYLVPDSREGWVSLARTSINAFVGKGTFPEVIDFTEVRKKGERIKGFGGTASGPGPLAKLVKCIARTLMPAGVNLQFEESFNEETGEITHLQTVVEGVGKAYRITSAHITDIFNMVGACVVAGGVRRSAEIMFGEADDAIFRKLKDPSTLIPLTNRASELEVSMSATTDEMAFARMQAELDSVNAQIDEHPLRSHRWASNNSILGTVGMDYEEVGESIALNGEPGILWLKNAQDFGRMVDPANYKDRRAQGANPCSEQTLESYELCCLVETYPAHHDTYEDFEKTIKNAYLYAKTVTLMPTHDPRTNAVMNRNRRIGCSMSGIRQAIAKLGRREFLNWCDKAYKYIQKLDVLYSDWLGTPLSIKTTSVKPSGTVSLLCGATPGIHPPHSPFYIRNIRVNEHSPLRQAALDAGYKVEKDAYADSTFVISFPVKTENCTKGKQDVSIWEQVALASDLQRYWADNQVSVTVTFKPEEAKEIPTVLEVFEDRLKSISFLPLMDDHGYVQAPYIAITEDEYNAMMAGVTPMNLDNSKQEVEDKFCTTDVCEIRSFNMNVD